MARLLRLRLCDQVAVIPIWDSDCRVWLDASSRFRAPKTASIGPERTLEDLTNGRYAENSTCYWCLARNRRRTRPSILGARLPRSRKLEAHYQKKPIPYVSESCACRRRHRGSKHGREAR